MIMPNAVGLVVLQAPAAELARAALQFEVAGAEAEAVKLAGTPEAEAEADQMGSPSHKQTWMRSWTPTGWAVTRARTS